MEKKIFIADDEVGFVTSVKSRLEFEGFGVATAADGEEALHQIREQKPDLVLLDLMMPSMNGYQLCCELKCNPETEDIPVVMVTARSLQSDKFWGKETGADDYITKPFDMEELLEKIRDILDQ